MPENHFYNIDSSGQLSPSGQVRRKLYDPFLNREKKIAASFQILHLPPPTFPFWYTLPQLLYARDAIQETISCSQEPSFLVRANKWLQEQEVDRKNYASGRVCSLNYILTAEVQAFQMQDKNSDFS